ncbi:MAG: type I restriction enzyme HsdR N-terminal domain-containing protein [Bacteroidota bacterium]
MRQKRADVVVFSDSGSPLMIVECKAPDVKINQGVAEQVSQYNFSFQVRYLLLTNGLDHYVFEVDKDKKQIISLSKIPEYKTINDEG